MLLFLQLKSFCMLQVFDMSMCFDCTHACYTCQHMEVFKMQFYMTCMCSRETSLYVLNMHVNCSNIAVIVVFIHVSICDIHCVPVSISYVHTERACCTCQHKKYETCIFA